MTAPVPPNQPSRRSLLVGAAVAAGVATAPPPTAAASRPGVRPRRRADLVLLDGDVRTLDRRGSREQALAVRRGVVVAVGSNREIRRLAGRGTTVIDLNGRSALPGINDAHVHGLAAGVSLPPLSLDVAYPTVTSIADIVVVVEAAVQAAAPGAWVRGSGWNLALLDEWRADPNRLPTAADLDPVSPNSPVVLRDFSFHTVWANSRAMELAGITAATPDPPGGLIRRDENGNPIGLFEETAQVLILGAMPALPPSEIQAGLTRAVDVLLSQGVTSHTDPGLMPDEIEVYRAAAETLPSRVNLMLSSSASLNLGGTGGGSAEILLELIQTYPRPTEFLRRRLTLSGVKIFADGIPPYLSAWVYDPYVGTTATGGLVLAGADDAERVAELRQIVRVAHRAGFQVGTHATGDRTCDEVTAAYVSAIRRGRRNRDPRHYTIHSDLVTDAALRRLARYGLGTNMNPSIKSAIADAMIGVLGEERAARQWPTRSALDAGTTLTSSSDWPVGPPDWRAGVVNAIRRQDQISGNVSGPEERIGLDEAIASYTTGPAYQDHAERWKGRLVPGMVADVCVLDGPMPGGEADVESLLETPVAMTIFDGDVVYDLGSGARPAGAGGARTAAAVAAAGGSAATCQAHGAAEPLQAVTCCCTRAPQLLRGQA